MNQGREANDYVWKRGCAAFIDAVGYSTRMEKFPVETRRELVDHFSKLENMIVAMGGQVVDRAGDGMFAEFEKAVSALKCFKAFQEQITQFNETIPIDQRMRFRVGLAFGDILQEEVVISGPKVNIAARLQSIAEPGAIVLDDDAHQEVSGDEEHSFSDMGFRILKGISNPIRAWRLNEPGEAEGSASQRVAASYEADDTQELDGRGIAILPFEVQGGDDETSYLADGLASDIADSLARSGWLRVISSRSSMNYQSGVYDDTRIGDELGVRYLLKGTVRFAGTAVRISVSLVDASSAQIVWSENFNRADKSFFDLQDEIAPLVVAKIEPEFLRHESNRAASSRPRNVDAWDLLMRSRWHFWRGSPKHIKQALACAEKALLLEPDNAETLAQLSFCYMTQAWSASSVDIVEEIAEALRLARQAVNVNDTNPNAHFTLGTALSLSGELQAAILAERRALELYPNFAGALGELARLLAFEGKAEEARQSAVKAIGLSPTDPHISLWVRSLALAAFTERKFDEAVELARESVAKRPDWFFNYTLLASCEALNGNIEKAQAAFAEEKRILPYYPMPALKLGHPFQRKEDMTLFLEGLRLAGWQER